MKRRRTCSVSAPTVGLLDTNVFIHAQANDVWSQECRKFLQAVEHGSVRVELLPVVLHELTYALPRYLRQLSRADVATYLLSVLHWPGIRGDNELMVDAVKRWARTPGLAFVDAYLAALAAHRRCPIFTKNVRELSGQGVDVPAVLPA